MEGEKKGGGREREIKEQETSRERRREVEKLTTRYRCMQKKIPSLVPHSININLVHLCRQQYTIII